MIIPKIDKSASEGDVETQVVIPLLNRTELLGIPLENIKSKEFLASFDIGKGAKSRKGYSPDYCVYILSLPVAVIEVKAPNVEIAIAWEEASLYSHALNKRFKSGENPCEVIFATNGMEFCAGSWDNQEPQVFGLVSDLGVGGDLLSSLQNIMSFDKLKEISFIISESMKAHGFKRPFNQGVGPAIINSKIEPNTFAADLSPVLRRYFSSRDQNDDPDIYKNAYVSSSEITSYDQILESFLKDRLSKSKNRIEIITTKNKADGVSRRLTDLASMKTSGELQLITGGVGSGKSLFARRYKEFLQPEPLRESSHWAFLDFNFAPDDLTDAKEWVCETFAKSVIEEGAPINPRDGGDQERIFADDLSDRAAFYDRVERADPGRGLLEKARDLEGWRQDPIRLARGLARHLQGDRGEVIIAVFDNVDRRDVRNQLAAFHLALWFMHEMRCLVVLQMRDTTFEAHKNERPLDTYRTGQIFHISPPRFIDVVKRRLELSLNELAKHAPETIRYTTPSGAVISYPKSRAGEFLRGIYLELFQRTSNTSRILESLAGRNVRRALDMFMAIINSGHMPEDLIASVATGSQLRRLPEYLVLKILMRQDYRFYNSNSGFISNIFYLDQNWNRPSNFICIEVLFFLIGNRKVTGENGQMGYVSVLRLVEKLEKFGYVQVDIIEACNYLLAQELIEADSTTSSSIKGDSCVKATASGWAHLRILASRSEYLVSVLPTTPINDSAFEHKIFEAIQIENRIGRLNYRQSEGLLRQFLSYLIDQYENLKVHQGYADNSVNGAAYVIRKVNEALNFEYKAENAKLKQIDWLDS